MTTVNQIYNIGGTDELDNLSLIKLIMEIFGPGEINLSKIEITTILIIP